MNFRVFLAALFIASSVHAGETKLRALVLSGANNHDWAKTTPAIRAVLEETGRFTVEVEENVPDLNPGSFAPYAVIVSNFNTFGKDAPAKKSWDAATRKAFLDHIAKGNGLVIVHAGSSVFYDWPEFQNLACGTWKDGTNHGQIHVDRVIFTDAGFPDHPRAGPVLDPRRVLAENPRRSRRPAHSPTSPPTQPSRAAAHPKTSSSPLKPAVVVDSRFS